MQLVQIVIEDEDEDVKDILNFIPRFFTLPGKTTLDQGLEQPLTFENLLSSGYRMWKDEFNGLDLDHAVVALESFGKLHALGMVLFEKNIVEDHNIMEYDFMETFSDPLLDIIDGGMMAFL